MVHGSSLNVVWALAIPRWPMIAEEDDVVAHHVKVGDFLKGHPSTGLLNRSSSPCLGPLCCPALSAVPGRASPRDSSPACGWSGQRNPGDTIYRQQIFCTCHQLSTLPAPLTLRSAHIWKHIILHNINRSTMHFEKAYESYEASSSTLAQQESLSLACLHALHAGSDWKVWRNCAVLRHVSKWKERCKQTRQVAS